MLTRSMACLLPLLVCPYAPAAVQVYFNGTNHPAARTAWMADAASFTTIDFTGFPENTIITNQYQDQGILFTDGTDRVFYSSSFPNDGVGLYGAIDTIHVSFLQPTHSIAVDFPGDVAFQLYWGGALVYASPGFFAINPGGFAGLISDTPFDAAVIFDPTGNVNIDDLFFGPPIPAAPALAALALVALFPTSRRRRS